MQRRLDPRRRPDDEDAGADVRRLASRIVLSYVRSRDDDVDDLGGLLRAVELQLEACRSRLRPDPAPLADALIALPRHGGALH